ncbi:hypothetical protein, partial [Endozoicomonas sp. SESOKO3]|uniref:hypothetical protein n=1 Tax=Endozoicomonas sp. SESOKO3 TaxID=2828744 RepID=UPI002148E8CE
RRLQQLTGDYFSPYRLMPLPVADAELPLAQARIPTERHMSAFVRADSIGDPLSGVGLLAYGDRFRQAIFFQTQQAGHQLARQVTSPPSDAMATLFTHHLLRSLQDIVAPGGNDIDPFRVSSPDLLVSVLGKDDLSALYSQKVRNDFSELGQQYVRSLRALLGHCLADKLAEKKVPRLNARKRSAHRKLFQHSLSLGVKKRLKQQPDGTVSFTDPVSQAFVEEASYKDNLPVVTDPRGGTYVLVNVPEIHSAAFPDNLRNVLLMLQSSGPLEQATAQTLINTIETAYSRHSPFLVEQRLDEKITRLALNDVVTLATEMDNIDTEHKAARSLTQKLLLRLVGSVVNTLESGGTPDRQQKLLIAELSNRLPDNNSGLRIPLPDNRERVVYLDPSLPFNQDQHSSSRIVLGVRSPFFLTAIDNSAYRSQLRELATLNGIPRQLNGVLRYFNRPNEFIDSLLAWHKWQTENNLEAIRPIVDLRLESSRLIADSRMIVRRWQQNEPVIIQVGLSDVRPGSSDRRLARVMTGSYGLALLLQLQARQAARPDIDRALAIWQINYQYYSAGRYGFDNALTMRQLPANSDPVYQLLVRDSHDCGLKFARGTA